MSEPMKCMFCSLGGDRELELGSLHVSGEVVAHYFCMLFSTELPKDGKDEEEGILGFLPIDIMKELQRGKKLACTFCSKKGATIGCSEKGCRRSYHYGCGLQQHVLYRFTDDVRSYCHQHREYQQGKGLGEKMDCPICMDELLAEPKTAVCSPCCNNNSWFHKICMQKFALSAGYCFKCPLCNDTQVFVKEMQKVGVYVPRKDASWELESDAFSEMEPLQCDASECRCPEGRNLDDLGTQWEIIPCFFCESSGIHVGCDNQLSTYINWTCPTCMNVIMKRMEEEERQRNTREEVPQATSRGVSVEGSTGASCSKTAEVRADNGTSSNLDEIPSAGEVAAALPERPSAGEVVAHLGVFLEWASARPEVTEVQLRVLKEVQNQVYLKSLLESSTAP